MVKKRCWEGHMTLESPGSGSGSVSDSSLLEAAANGSKTWVPAPQIREAQTELQAPSFGLAQASLL